VQYIACDAEETIGSTYKEEQPGGLVEKVFFQASQKSMPADHSMSPDNAENLSLRIQT